MSLLMDALKKAEREKQRLASEKNNERSNSSAENVEEIDPLHNSHTKTAATKTESSDESWAFDTSELELEPISPEITQESPSANDQISDLDDTTIKEAIPDLPDPAITSTYDDLTLQTDSGLQQSDFDHDATLPSERAIQSSLKDYFEASQSITMDQDSIDAKITPDVTEHSVTSTSPLDLSSTHVTAHTIFTAGSSRKASTGLAKYALFGTLALILGLGAVALYYSYTTPSTINIPSTLPTVATMVDPAEQPQTVEVDVNTVKIDPPFEPGTTPAELQDPVLAAVVEEVTPPTADNSDLIAKQDQITQAEQIKKPIKSAPVKETIFIKQESLNKPIATKTWAQAPTVSQGNNAPQYAITKHKVINFSQREETTLPEKFIVLDEQPTQTVATTQTLQGGYTLEEQNYPNEQPIEVVSAEDFADGLKMPKSAIKITKGRAHKINNSDLTTAYRAYQVGDYLNAKAAYRKVLSSRPDNRDALLGVAAIAVMEGNYETAYRYYQHLLQQNPQDQIAKAAMFNLQGNAGGNVTESQLKLSLDQNPDSPQVHFSLGSFYASQLRWPEAQKAFFDAFNADQKNADYAYNLAVSLDQIGQPTPALSYYRTALKLAEQSPVSFNTSQVLARIQKLSGLVKN